MKLFVYGTLKKGYNNHHYLSKAKFLGEARTLAIFTMLNAGFPVLVNSNNGLQVEGELYEWDEKEHPEILNNLNHLESEGYMFDLTEIYCVSKTMAVNCHCYLGNRDYWRFGHNPDYKFITPEQTYRWER